MSQFMKELLLVLADSSGGRQHPEVKLRKGSFSPPARPGRRFAHTHETTGQLSFRIFAALNPGGFERKKALVAI